MRRIVPALLAALLVQACQENAPPPLGNIDLRRAVVISMIGEDNPALSSWVASDPCTDLHGTEISLYGDTTRIGSWDMAAMRFGLRDGLKGWHDPIDEKRSIDAGVMARLGRASARALLRLHGAPTPRIANKQWPKSCTSHFSLSAPVYAGNFAFVDSNSVCGGWCGGGGTMALEYRNGRWQLVATRATWMA